MKNFRKNAVRIALVVMRLLVMIDQLDVPYHEPPAIIQQGEPARHFYRA